jgi:DNA modification methylase
MKCINEAHGDNFAFYQGDCVEVIRQMPSASVDMALYSPPFSSVYTYSDSTRDMGNCDSDEEFMEQYRWLAEELFRVVRPGRLVAVHCKDLVYYRSSSDRHTSGLRDFPGDLVRVHKAAGFDLHSKITIWTDPVLEQQRTKAHGLLYKQLRADSSFSRQGLAEYVMVFRRWPTNEEEESLIRPVTHTASDFPLDQWQEWASCVWMTIRRTNVLNVQIARDDEDEKHMCPLQLDVIERAVRLWTNPGDVVLSPFGGIASEGVGALTYGRKFVGVELKESYWNTGVANLRELDRPRQHALFGK